MHFDHHCLCFCLTLSFSTIRFGANGFIVPRPDICDLLARHVPKEHMHMGKKVIASEQSKEGVRLSFADGTTAEGHILVGADGAYSTIRQHLYNQLKKEDRLLASDAEPLPFSSICLVGQTKPLDPKDFPNLSLEESQIQTILGKGTPYSVRMTSPSILRFTLEHVMTNFLSCLTFASVYLTSLECASGRLSRPNAVQLLGLSVKFTMKNEARLTRRTRNGVLVLRTPCARFRATFLSLVEVTSQSP